MFGNWIPIEAHIISWIVIKSYISIWDQFCLFSTKESTTDIANVAVQLKNVWHCNCRTVLSVISLCSLLSLIRVCTPWLMLVINWQLLQSSINFAPAKNKIYSHTYTFSRCGHFGPFCFFSSIVQLAWNCCECVQKHFFNASTHFFAKQRTYSHINNISDKYIPDQAYPFSCLWPGCSPCCWAAVKRWSFLLFWFFALRQTGNLF